jgi:hypothetical protein
VSRVGDWDAPAASARLRRRRKSHREVVGRHARAKKQIEFAHEYVPFDFAAGPHNQCSPGVT